MKKVLFLLASAQFAFGQSTVVTCFDENHEVDPFELPFELDSEIGIIPVDEFNKVNAEVDRLKRELDVALRGQAAAKKSGQMSKKQSEEITTLRKQLIAAHKKIGADHKNQEAGFAKREQAMVRRVNDMEKKREEATQRFEKKLLGLRADFSKKQGEWEKRLVFVENERDEALRALEKSEIARTRDYEAWKKSAADWRKKVVAATRDAQVKNAQEAVANTARLAKDWQAERATLLAQVEQSQKRHGREIAAWEKAVASWQKKTEDALRTANLKEAQDAVANTARLAAAWQEERAELEGQVKEMTAQLAQLEGEIGVKGFQEKQAEVLRLGLMQKSKALQDLGSDADRLATTWKNEREAARRELEAMRDLYKSTARDVQTRDQRIKQLEASLSEKKKALGGLADEAQKLSKNWQTQKGGLQQQLVRLEKQLDTCQKKLKEAVTKEKATGKEARELAQEANKLKEAAQKTAKSGKEASTKLSKQLALAAELQNKLGLAKKSEGKLKDDLSLLQSEVGKLKKNSAAYQEQKERHGKEVAALQAELKKLKERYTVSERQLAAANQKLKANEQEIKSLKSKVVTLDKQLAQTQADLEAVRKEAESNQLAKIESDKSFSLLSSSMKKNENSGRELAALKVLMKDLDTKFGKTSRELELARKEADANKKAQALADQRQKRIAVLEKELSDVTTSQQNLGKELRAAESNFKKLSADYEGLGAANAEAKKGLAELEATKKKLMTSVQELEALRTKSSQLDSELEKTQQDLVIARKDADAQKKAAADAAASRKKAQNLQGQLGKLAVTHQELEGTLTTTLKDFKTLQASYSKLQTDSANGGEAAQKALAEKKAAEAELQKLRKQLQAKEATMQKAQSDVREAQEQKKAAETDAAAGKEALGKCETELTKARKKLSDLEKGQKQLAQEASELRKRFVRIQPVRYQLASANVVAQQQRVLAEVKQVLEVYPNAKFSIKGHTCNIGSEEANKKLSEDRAVVLKDFLLSNGITEERIVVVEGCGDTQPQSDNETEEGRRQNRRVEIEVVK